MPHNIDFHPGRGVIVVSFHGEISPKEELEAFLESVDDPRWFADALVLVDKRDAEMRVGPEDVAPQLRTVESRLARLGDVRIAHVVGRDYDFGMMRMLAAQGEARTGHDLGVFRDLDEAWACLGVEPVPLAPQGLSHTGDDSGDL